MSRAGRAAAWLAAAVLVLLGGAYYFTSEPAPPVIVRWREGATPERKAEIERRFGLVRPRDEEGRAAYDLVDTRPENIQELLEQPEVDDSGYLGERRYAVAGDAPDGRGRTWIADRLVISPELRIFRVVPIVVGACGLILMYTAVKAIAARRRRLRRLVAFVLGWRRPRFGVPS